MPCAVHRVTAMNAPLHREMPGAPAWDAAAALDQIGRQWDGDIVRRLSVRFEAGPPQAA